MSVEAPKIRLSEKNIREYHQVFNVLVLFVKSSIQKVANSIDEDNT